MTPRGSLVVLALTAACGGAKPAAPPQSPSNVTLGRTGPGATAPVDAAAICDRMHELAAGGCPSFTGYNLDRAECMEDYRKSLEDRGEDARQATIAFGHCVIDEPSCRDVEACVDQQLAGPDPGYRDCADHTSSAAVGRPRAEWDQRRGATADKFSDVKSTKAEPVEVCTIGAEMDWLMRIKCDDGSYPFKSDDHAHAARVGNVGPGGACRSIIDLYEVACPEGAYQVYIDAYVCPLP